VILRDWFMWWSSFCAQIVQGVPLSGQGLWSN
jgi:hypothetical protein